MFELLADENVISSSSLFQFPVR